MQSGIQFQITGEMFMKKSNFWISSFLYRLSTYVKSMFNRNKILKTYGQTNTNQLESTLKHHVS